MEPILTPTESLILDAARGIMGELEERSSSAAFAGERRPVELFHLGMLHAKARAASEAIFAFTNWHDAIAPREQPAELELEPEPA